MKKKKKKERKKKFKKIEETKIHAIRFLRAIVNSAAPRLLSARRKLGLVV